MLSLELVRSFVVLAAELNYGRAAKRLNISQPPLSRRIQSLEAQLSVTLFDRDHRSVSLTDAGRAFYPEAVAIIQHSEAAIQIARRANAAEVDRIALGFIGAATYEFLPALLQKARQERPNRNFVLLEKTSSEQVSALDAAEIDLGLIRPMVVPYQLRTCPVHRERLAVALPIDHPLAGKRRIPLDLLHGQEFIGYSQEGRYMHDLIEVALGDRRIRPTVVQRVARVQAILSLVSIGMGLALVPDGGRQACFDNVVFRPLEQPDEIVAEVHAVWRADDGRRHLHELLSSMALDRLAA